MSPAGRGRGAHHGHGLGLALVAAWQLWTAAARTLLAKPSRAEIAERPWRPAAETPPSLRGCSSGRGSAMPPLSWPPLRSTCAPCLFAETCMVVLTDGRHLIGTLSSYDQFGEAAAVAPRTPACLRCCPAPRARGAAMCRRAVAARAGLITPACSLVACQVSPPPQRALCWRRPSRGTTRRGSMRTRRSGPLLFEARTSC